MYQSPSLNRREGSYRAYVSANPASFSGAPIDDYRQDAIVAASPARTALTTDATAWGTQPVADSIQQRICGQQQPDRLSGASGSIGSGNTP